ncbi:beta-ketoacyl-[acyl-carrier-protein] synthase family protein [bacterium]|nr:beta-ketoacyl-[acyl-carrier-protein] synthase family protein [bacterium]
MLLRLGQERRKEKRDIRFKDRRRFDRRMNVEEFKRLLFVSKKEDPSQKRRIAITGIGVVAPNGIGKDNFWDALSNGISGIKPISMFDTGKYDSKSGGEIADFDAGGHLGRKGIRDLDRSSKLISVAVKLALEDSGIDISNTNTYDTGIVVGTSLGSVRSISEFDITGLIEGPSYVNPAHFPNTVINSPASHASIMFDIRGLNSTISSGFCSSLDAIIYACDSINLNKVNTIMAGAVEEFCQQTFFGFYMAGCLAGAKGRLEQSMPFDRRRNGLVLGEGSGVLMLEELEHAISRKAKIYGEVLGFARNFFPCRKSRYCHSVEGVIEVMKKSLANAELKPGAIDLICSGANSSPYGDKIETLALKEVFGDHIYKIPVTAVKSMLGEGYSVSGSFQTMAGLLAINKGIISPTINHLENDPACNLDYVPNKSRMANINIVMINTFSPYGNNSSLIIGKLSKEEQKRL